MKGIVRLNDGTKQVYNIDDAIGSIDAALKCLWAEVPDVKAALVSVPNCGSNLTKEPLEAA